MKKVSVIISILLATMASTVFAQTHSVELTQEAAEVIGPLLRNAEENRDYKIIFNGGPVVTLYSIGNLMCYFLNEDDSVGCSIENQFSGLASQMTGQLLHQAKQKGNAKINFQAGPDVTIYSVGNVSCQFKNADNSFNCFIN